MTYEQLLETAIEHFGRRGFEGASTREIAAASGTAMSSITYHFGGKEGLYLAAARHIGEQISERQRDAIAAGRAALEGERDAAMDGAVAMITSFGRMMLQPETAAWSCFMVREQQEPTAAFECLFESVISTVLSTLAGLIGRVRPDLSDTDARATAFFVISQAIGLRMGRATLCRMLGSDSIDAAGEVLLLPRLSANVRSILAGETP